MFLIVSGYILSIVDISSSLLASAPCGLLDNPVEHLPYDQGLNTLMDADTRNLHLFAGVSRELYM